MTQCKSFWLYMTQCKSFWLYMNLILVEYESIFESHFGCIWISSWLNMNQFLNRILVVYESHFGCVWISFWLYMKIILVVYWNCFGCQKNKTNSLLTSSEGNGFWEPKNHPKISIDSPNPSSIQAVKMLERSIFLEKGQGRFYTCHTFVGTIYHWLLNLKYSNEVHTCKF